MSALDERERIERCYSGWMILFKEFPRKKAKKRKGRRDVAPDGTDGWDVNMCLD